MRRGFFIVFAIGLLLFLKWQFPYAALRPDDALRIVYLLIVLSLVAAGRQASRVSTRRMAMQLAVWLGVFGMVILGYSYRGSLPAMRLMGELVPQRAQMAQGGDLQIHSDESGHFHVEASVNGVPVNFMIDTGASDIVLSPDDARRIGIDTDALNYNRLYSTANGAVKGAPIRLERLQIGAILHRDQAASVNGGPLEESLLGMRFLSELSGYSVRGPVMTLSP